MFSFNPGSYPAIMRSSEQYNDGFWHKLVAHRYNDNGRLEVDGFIEGSATVSGESKHIDHQVNCFKSKVVKFKIKLAAHSN